MVSPLKARRYVKATRQMIAATATDRRRAQTSARCPVSQVTRYQSFGRDYQAAVPAAPYLNGRSPEETS
jgi:hypothetical protein